MESATTHDDALRRARAAVLSEIAKEPPATVVRVAQNLRKALARDYLSSDAKLSEVDAAIAYVAPHLAERIRPLLIHLSLDDGS